MSENIEKIELPSSKTTLVKIPIKGSEPLIYYWFKHNNADYCIFKNDASDYESSKIKQAQGIERFIDFIDQIYGIKALENIDKDITFHFLTDKVFYQDQTGQVLARNALLYPLQNINHYVIFNLRNVIEKSHLKKDRLLYSYIINLEIIVITMYSYKLINTSNYKQKKKLNILLVNNLVLARDLARDLDRDLDQVLDRYPVRARALDLARDLALDLALALARVLDPDRDRTLAQDRDRALDRDRDKVLDRTRVLAQVLAPNKDLNLNLDQILASAQNQDLYKKINLELSRVISIIYQFISIESEEQKIKFKKLNELSRYSQYLDLQQSELTLEKAEIIQQTIKAADKENEIRANYDDDWKKTDLTYIKVLITEMKALKQQAVDKGMKPMTQDKVLTELKHRESAEELFG